MLICYFLFGVLIFAESEFGESECGESAFNELAIGESTFCEYGILYRNVNLFLIPY